MDNWYNVMAHKTFRFIDQTTDRQVTHTPFTALTSFAVDDTLAESVSDGVSPPVMRLWVHPDTIVLGIVDGRLPFLEDGVRFLKSNGYQVVIRNSGGLAVALDEGVLNISLIIPGVKHVSIYDCYESMVRFVKSMLHNVTDDIQAYEITGSYCPGDYDLSINGKKFAGISQRRIKDSAAIQIYLDVEGNSEKRATIVKQFYDYSKKDAETKFTYPEVHPETMASLSELLDKKITVEDMKARALAALEKVTTTVTMDPFSQIETDVFKRRLKQMEQRNEDISLIR